MASKAARATYAKDGSIDARDRVAIVLEQPTSIRGARDDHRLAYPLRVSKAGNDETFWLDGDFRAVRSDYPCGPCVYLDWAVALRPLPFGMALPAQLQTNDTLWLKNLEGKPTRVEPIVKRSGGMMRIAFSPGQIPDARWPFIVSSADYRDSSLFPTHFVIENASWSRTDYQPAAELQPIEPWPLPLEPEPTKDLARELFPGYSQELPGFLDVVPRDAMDALRNKTPEPDQMLASGGCIIAMQFFLVHRSDDAPGPILPISIKPEVQVIIDIAKGASEGKRWQLSWGTDALGKRRYDSVTGPSEMQPLHIPGGCDAVRRSPPITRSAVDFLNAAKTLPITSPAPPDFAFDITNGAIYERPAENGWGRYSLLYYPPGSNPNGTATYSPNNQAFNPNLLAWDVMQVAPADVQAVDQPT